MMLTFKRIFFSLVAAALYVVCINSAISEDRSIRLINIDESKLHDDYDRAMNGDSLEKYNRAVFSFNKSVDDYFLAPVARGYRYGVPQWGRNRVRDFYSNLQEPRNFVNSLLQGDIEGTFRAFWRAIVNTTFGIAGTHDVARGFGLEQKDKYFSQTLGVYGLNAGEYVVLPLLGPSTYRDFTGYVVDNFMEPDTYIEPTGAAIALSAGEAVSKRERLLDITDQMEEDSFDLYSTHKSSYLQNRKKNIEETAK